MGRRGRRPRTVSITGFLGFRFLFRSSIKSMPPRSKTSASRLSSPYLPSRLVNVSIYIYIYASRRSNPRDPILYIFRNNSILSISIYSMQRFESMRFSWRREEKRKEKKERLFVKFFFNLTIEKLRIIFSPPGRKSTDQLFSSRTPQLYVYIVNSESPISFLLLPSLFFPYRGRLTRIKKRNERFSETR